MQTKQVSKTSILRAIAYMQDSSKSDAAQEADAPVIAAQEADAPVIATTVASLRVSRTHGYQSIDE